MVLLSKTDTTGTTRQAVINITSGKILVPMDVHSIHYDFGGKLLVAGLAGSYMADTDGRLLFPIPGEIWRAAFCQSGWYAFDGHANTTYLFNKKDEKTASFKGLEIVKQVDSLHFLTTTDNGYTYLINSKGKKVFGDGCATEMTVIENESEGIQSPVIITRGLCYHNDDVTFILQDKKGKWFDPLKNFGKTYYVEYVLPLNVQSTDEKEWFCYLAGYDNKEEKTLVALLNYKGEIVLRLHTDGMHRPFYVLRDTAFIYLLNEYSSESAMVFLADGTLLLKDAHNYRNYLDPSIESQGYFCFANHELNSTYLYHAGSKKLITLEGVEHVFETVEQVAAKFQ